MTDKPPIVVQDAQFAALDKVQRLSLERNVLATKADFSSYEFGLALAELRDSRACETKLGIPFESWVTSELTDRRGHPLKMTSVSKLIEQASALQHFPEAVAYFKGRLLRPDEVPCCNPQGRTPCVSWWSLWEAYRLSQVSSMRETLLGEIEQTHPDWPHEDQVLTAEKMVETEIIMLAHRTVAEIRTLISTERDQQTEPEDSAFVRIAFNLDRNVADQLTEAIDFVLRVDGVDPEDKNVTDTVKIERLANLVLDVKEKWRGDD